MRLDSEEPPTTFTKINNWTLNHKEEIIVWSGLVGILTFFLSIINLLVYLLVHLKK